MRGLTEECFKQGHLEFFGDMQRIQYDGEDGMTIFDFEALRTKEGTFPEGSQWTRSPIPACAFPEGKLNETMYRRHSFPCPEGPQFPAPAEGMEGRMSPEYREGEWNHSVVDQLVVPRDLTSGDYVLSFRLVE